MAGGVCIGRGCLLGLFSVRSQLVEGGADMKKFAVICGLLFMGTITGGCGGGSGRPSLVPVTGKVLQGTEPVANAQVLLMPELAEKSEYSRPSTATTDASGSFQPMTYLPGDGLPVGKYRVGIVKSIQEGTGGREYNPEETQRYPYRVRWLLPKRYADPETSGLTIEVTAKGMTPAEITLEAGGEEVETIVPKVY